MLEGPLPLAQRLDPNEGGPGYVGVSSGCGPKLHWRRLTPT